MEIEFQPFRDFPAGTIARLLCDAYSEMQESNPEFWTREKMNWLEYDRQIFEFPDTVGSAGFVSVLNRIPIGMASWDPRQYPIGIMGHNCMAPGHRGKGYGKVQLREVLRILRDKGFKKVIAETGGRPFFVPAQRMYMASGFRRVGRGVDHGCPTIKYEFYL
jgi:GNAT superfamily N-acetyltransferase